MKLPPYKYRPVNWMDGMKISSQHFSQQEQAFAENVRDARGVLLNQWNYGLLPSFDNQSPSLKIQMDLDHAQNLVVNVITCRAVTRGGGRIEVNQTLSKEWNLNELPNPSETSNSESGFLSIVISLPPGKYQPVGEPDPEEQPPRHPFLQQHYQLDIVDDANLEARELGPFQMILGKIQLVGGQAKAVQKYIPPCTTTGSFPLLFNIYNDLKQFLFEMENLGYMIVGKIGKKSQLSEMDHLVRRVTIGWLDALSDGLDVFRLVIPEQPPIFMIEYFARFARKFKCAIHILAEAEREKVLSYLCQWAPDSKPADLENVLASLMNVDYQHLDIGKSLDALQHFTNLYGPLFQKLSQLEYIAQTGDNPFYEVESKSEKNKGWKF